MVDLPADAKQFTYSVGNGARAYNVWSGIYGGNRNTVRQIRHPPPCRGCQLIGRLRLCCAALQAATVTSEAKVPAGYIRRVEFAFVYTFAGSETEDCKVDSAGNLIASTNEMPSFILKLGTTTVAHSTRTPPTDKALADPSAQCMR